MRCVRKITPPHAILLFKKKKKKKKPPAWKKVLQYSGDYGFAYSHFYFRDFTSHDFPHTFNSDIHFIKQFAVANSRESIFILQIAQSKKTKKTARFFSPTYLHLHEKY